MLRFIALAVPLLVLLLALFGFAVELLDVEPKSGSVIRLALLEQPRVPGQLVVGTWLVETSGLIALFLLTQGRFGAWWLDGLVAGWVAWIFRGPLLVITIVVAASQPQDAWWALAFGWWVLYSACGLSLALLARRSGLEPWLRPREESATVSGVAASESGPPIGDEPTAERSEVSLVESDEAIEALREDAVDHEIAIEMSEGLSVESEPILVDSESAASESLGDAEKNETSVS